MSTTETSQELRVAESIVSVLPAGSVMRVCSDDRDTIRFAVRADGLKLREVVLSRRSLRRLLGDPAGEIKIEYLQRDLSRSARRRTEFRYPHEIRRVIQAKGRAAVVKALRNARALTFASAV